MKWVVIVLALGFLALVTWRNVRNPTHLQRGDLAPTFELVDQDNHVQRLIAYRGRWLVMYFYPKDDTPGCTREACQFRDDIQSIQALSASVVGISVDTTASHAQFAAKHHLSFPLLADTGGQVAALYGALLKFGPWKIARRITFIITPDGHIAHIFQRVNPAAHAREVTRTIKALQSRSSQKA